MQTGYTILKILHLTGVVLFLGNIISAFFWMRQALRSGDVKTAHHIIGGIRKADKVFTLPGAILLFITGVGAAMHGRINMFHTGWILLSILLFLLSGFAFSAKLAKLQRRMFHFTESKPELLAFDWEKLNHMARQWHNWWLVAVLAPFVAFLLMIMKFPG